jgi:hypothetical protein
MRVLCISSLLLAGCAAAPKTVAVAAPHETPPPAAQRTIDIELTDSSPGTSKMTRYTLALVDDRGWSNIATHSPVERLEVKARADRYHSWEPTIVSVEFTRDTQGQPKVSIAESTIFFAGRRTVLGHLEKEGGGATEVALVTR